MQTVTLKVEGMTCSHCEMNVSRELKKVPGVTEASASAQGGTATVTYDPQRASLPALEAAVREAGYFVAGTKEPAGGAHSQGGHSHGGHDHTRHRHGGHGHGGCCCH